jgi:hypothetical protein
MSKPSGLEKIPPIMKKPFWTDTFFWWGVVAAVFWLAVVYWIAS